ncbi:MAG: hypothetical protein JXM79_05610 [Sedimentisphaerales bacterium]|nr:hypothetical protein [Sedimentisphaerales bacterium]
MKSVLNLRSEIIQLIKAKLEHFHSFRQAADFRGGQVKHYRQFKTEKWLQAELVHYFWSKQIYVITEYSDEKWDLCIEKPNDEGNFLLAIKCLADSDQSAKGDFDGVRKDMEAIGKYQSMQAALLLVLPLDTNDKKRTDYTKNMLERIEQYDLYESLIMKKDKILFASNGNEGIWVVWIEPK